MRYSPMFSNIIKIDNSIISSMDIDMDIENITLYLNNLDKF